jgi:hypothetical protein
MTDRNFSRRDLFGLGVSAVAMSSAAGARARARAGTRLVIRFVRGGLWVVHAASGGKEMTAAYPKGYTQGCCDVPAHQPVLKFDNSAVEVTGSTGCAVSGDTVTLSGAFTVDGVTGSDLVLNDLSGDLKEKHPNRPWDTTDWESFKWVPVLNGRLSPNAFHPGATARVQATDLLASIKLTKGAVAAGAPPDPADTALWRPRDRKHLPAKLEARALTDTLVYTVELTGDEVKLSGACVYTFKSRTAGRDIHLELEGGPVMNDASSYEPGAELTHFCNYYRFLENFQERDQLSPRYAGAFWSKPKGKAAAGNEPFPGRFCPGALVVV